MAVVAIGFAAQPELCETLASWRQWLSGERRVSGHTLDAYLADVGAFLSFLADHLGRLPGLEDLSDTRLADFRSWLSERAGAGLAASSRA
ncbi:MAG: site-specific integrase, partial [Rhodospirillaceae bacterium]